LLASISAGGTPLPPAAAFGRAGSENEASDYSLLVCKAAGAGSHVRQTRCELGLNANDDPPGLPVRADTRSTGPGRHQVYRSGSGKGGPDRPRQDSGDANHAAPDGRCERASAAARVDSRERHTLTDGLQPRNKIDRASGIGEHVWPAV